MEDNVRSFKMNACFDTSSLEEMMGEYKKMINRINFHYDGLEKAINDLRDYKPKLEIKYSVAADSNKYCQEGKHQ